MTAHTPPVPLVTTVSKIPPVLRLQTAPLGTPVSARSSWPTCNASTNVTTATGCLTPPRPAFRRLSTPPMQCRTTVIEDPLSQTTRVMTPRVIGRVINPPVSFTTYTPTPSLSGSRPVTPTIGRPGTASPTQPAPRFALQFSAQYSSNPIDFSTGPPAPSASWNDPTELSWDARPMSALLKEACTANSLRDESPCQAEHYSFSMSPESRGRKSPSANAPSFRDLGFSTRIDSLCSESQFSPLRDAVDASVRSFEDSRHPLGPGSADLRYPPEDSHHSLVPGSPDLRESDQTCEEPIMVKASSTKSQEIKLDAAANSANPMSNVAAARSGAAAPGQNEITRGRQQTQGQQARHSTTQNGQTRVAPMRQFVTDADKEEPTKGGKSVAGATDRTPSPILKSRVSTSSNVGAQASNTHSNELPRNRPTVTMGTSSRQKPTPPGSPRLQKREVSDASRVAALEARCRKLERSLASKDADRKQIEQAYAGKVRGLEEQASRAARELERRERQVDELSMHGQALAQRLAENENHNQAGKDGKRMKETVLARQSADVVLGTSSSTSAPRRGGASEGANNGDAQGNQSRGRRGAPWQDRFSSLTQVPDDLTTSTASTLATGSNIDCNHTIPRHSPRTPLGDQPGAASTALGSPGAHRRTGAGSTGAGNVAEAIRNNEEVLRRPRNS